MRLIAMHQVMHASQGRIREQRAPHFLPGENPQIAACPNKSSAHPESRAQEPLPHALEETGRMLADGQPTLRCRSLP